MELRKKPNTKTYNTDNGIAVSLYSTEIFNLDLEKHIITLRTGGHFTATTKRRINQVFTELNLPFTLWQKDYDWFVRKTGTDLIWKFEGNELNIPA